MPGLVPERDGYLPGVPCWVDASEPDPEAADGFYRGLFGWEFEDVIPPEAPGKYFMARIRGLDVAAVGWIPDAAPPMATWNTLPLCMESSGLALRITPLCGARRAGASPFLPAALSGLAD